MDNMLYETEMLEYIHKQLENYESQQALAQAIGIDPTAFSRILQGQRHITDQVAEFFGRKRVVLFVVPTKETELS